MFRNKRSNTLYCFSPAVMILTIIIELSLVAWVLTRYTIRTPQRVILALLVFLAAFQLAEFNVCASKPVSIIWSQLGYGFITVLPALALGLVIRLRGNTLKPLSYLGYAMGLLLIIGFVLLPSSLKTGVCSANYVIFILDQPLSFIYGLYYFGLESIGLYLSFLASPKSKANEQLALRWMGVAYLAMMVPSLIIYLLFPAARIAIPSIMCGFAVLFGLIITLKVAPLISKKR